MQTALRLSLRRRLRLKQQLHQQRKRLLQLKRQQLKLLQQNKNLILYSNKEGKPTMFGFPFCFADSEEIPPLK
jgi:hypothetical protein